MKINWVLGTLLFLPLTGMAAPQSTSAALATNQTGTSAAPRGSDEGSTSTFTSTINRTNSGAEVHGPWEDYQAGSFKTNQGALNKYLSAVPKSEQEAKKLERDAQAGDSESQFVLGLCYQNGYFLSEDDARAAMWYSRAAEKGLPAAQFRLGWCFYTGSGVVKDMSKAVKWFREAANHGFADAQFWLGVCYELGAGVARDYAEAARWYHEAAEQGDALAQSALGACYAKGEGVAQDYAEAVKWYRKAADQGDASAQHDLGLCYAKGEGVAQDLAEAVKWYRKSAENGGVLALEKLGICYHSGKGVAKDDSEAIKWYRKASERGSVFGQFSLGMCYLNGEGVPKDYSQAAKWFRLVAEKGDANGQFALGCCYWDGQGVPKNYVNAYKWINLAAAQGEKVATETLSELEASMTAAQIAEGQRLAAEFRPTESSERTSSDLSTEKEFGYRPTSSGSGFFITDGGFLVTNEHVVKDATRIKVVTKGGATSARIVKTDEANDIALLKADGSFSALPIVLSRSVRLGSTVGAVGFPNVDLQGFSPKFAKGEIAALSGAQDDAKYFQISVPVQPGNSGGALFDERGNVVGVVAAKLSASAAVATSGALPENVNYAIKSSYLLSFLESVPEVSAKLKEPNTKDRKFEDVVKDAEQAAVLVLVY